MTAKSKFIKPSSIVLLAVLLLTVGVGKTPCQAQNAQGPQTNEAKILLTAVDKDGRFVNNLRVEDLRVLQDGVPQKVDGFQKITDRSLSLAILIDTSASQERVLPGQRLAANSFLDSVIRPDRDQVAIATFTGTLTIEQNLTNDLPTLRRAIARAVFVPPPGYVRGGLIVGPPPPVSRAPGAPALGTAVWDVVIDACDRVLSQSPRETRRAIIMLTDGQDTMSRNKMSAVVDRAVRDDVAIYGIGIGDDSMYGLNKDGLRKLSERTGGRAFFPRKISELTDIFAEIGQELRTQYLISYNPAKRSGGSGKIKIEIVNPELRKSEVQLFYQQIVPNK